MRMYLVLKVGWLVAQLSGGSTGVQQDWVVQDSNGVCRVRGGVSMVLVVRRCWCAGGGVSMVRLEQLRPVRSHFTD